MSEWLLEELREMARGCATAVTVVLNVSVKTVLSLPVPLVLASSFL